MLNRTVKTMNTLIRILEISISFASYNVLPTHYCFIIAQQHSPPQFKAQQQQHPNGIFLGQTKLFHRCLEKVCSTRNLNRKRSLYVVRKKKPTKQTFRGHIAPNSVQNKIN